MKKDLLVALGLLWCSLSYAIEVTTIYGTFTVNEPVLEELIASQAFKRLGAIHQYGVNHYIHKTVGDYNRYDHSLGVFVLLRQHGAPLKEQIAGLLHDVSHTVFSHVGDHVAGHLKGAIVDQNDEAYQDDMHSWYLAQTDIASILAKYGYTIDEINHKLGDFPMLERSLPDICADRLEYQLYGAYAEGWMSADQLRAMAASVHYDEDRWYFDDLNHARTFGFNSIKLCTSLFGSAWNMIAYENAATALLRAVDLRLITMRDILFGTDDVTWDLLRRQNDAIINLAISRLLSAHSCYEQASESQYDVVCRAKFRGIDPWVLSDGGFKRLTELDAEFAQLYQETRQRYKAFQYYRYKN